MVFRGTRVYRQKYAPKCPPPPPNIHRRPQMPESVPDSHSPHRPFLRKQESHSAVHTNIGKFPTNLRPPEDHSCEGRNLIATCRQRRRILGGGRGNADNSVNCGTRHCEIPAYAGMVFRGTGVIAKKYAPKCPPPPPNIHRRRPKCQNHPRFPFPPQTIPAKAGISQCSACKYRQIPHNPPSPTRPFLRRQESHSAVHANIGGFPHNPPSPGRPFLRRQESHSAVHTNIGKSPTNLRPQVDHSCEGRNLIATCRQRRRILGGGRRNGDN